MADLYDVHAELFRANFEKALHFEEYVASGNEKQQKKWQDYRARILLPAECEQLLSRFTRKMNVLVLSGIWCGDCARQGPMLQAIAQSASCIECRFLDNQQNTELADELRVHGASRVPVVLSLSEDFFEVGRFGDRTLSHYRRKAQRELGPACDAGLVPPAADELEEEIRDWIQNFERLQIMLRLSPFLRDRYGD